ncbi:MAG: cytochrome b/b6 domain-containing protein [Actinomycetota bacterium]
MKRRTVLLLGVLALFVSTLGFAGIGAASTGHEGDGQVVPPGGGVVPPQETQDLVNPPAPHDAAGSVMHPNYALLDHDAQNVLTTGKPISTLNTCGQCHDVDFIVEHNYHASLGLDDLGTAGSTESGRAWDTSNGPFGRWNPITYRYLTPPGDHLVDLTTPEWIMTLGTRHPGSGPATTARDGSDLETRSSDQADPEASVLDPVTGETIAWDWETSGVEELNCFLCHLPNPAGDARTAEIGSGNFAWAGTATLAHTSLVTQSTDGWEWNPGAFNSLGQVAGDRLPIRKPTSEACSQCHGTVHTGEEPLTAADLDEGWSTLTTGQIYSDQRLSDSGLNFRDKEDLSRAWDIHAERGLDCVSCHSSINNGAQVQEDNATKPDHLVYDPRRSDLGDYLNKPLHEFAKGDTAQGTVAPQYDNTMRTCTGCHDPAESHQWLPYQDRHMQVLACETCHIPSSMAPAAEQYDWTVIHEDGTPVVTMRGVNGPLDQSSTVISGFEPAILLREEADGTKRLSPYNLVGSWYWTHGTDADERPVRTIDLEAAYLDGGTYAPEIVTVFDTDGDGHLSDAELAIDSNEKEAAVAARLASLGLSDPRIVGEVQPYSVTHGVVGGEWAVKDCQECHSKDSRLAQAIQLGNHTPGGVVPTFIGDGNTESTGFMDVQDDGSISYHPETTSGEISILGSTAGGWVDWVGLAAFLGVLAGIMLHAALRFWGRRKYGPPHHAETREAYLYSRYERFWHWMQAAVIIALVFTGTVIHWPGTATAFTWMIFAHNILALLLVINAVVALVDALATGFIKEFIPSPQGFFSKAIQQTTFYVKGIFMGEPHPFEKVEGEKLNPLQQATYFGILNVLLPAQIITGILIWGAQRWPDLTSNLGGLGFLLPVHTLIAWFFAAFVIMHVYLTTTGPTPLASIKGMITGWEEVEVMDEEVVS